MSSTGPHRTTATEPSPNAVETFMARWEGATGTERANYQLFIGDLCTLLGVPQPEPATDDVGENAYVYERRITFVHGDGQESFGFIDCYRRSAFVLEAKKVKGGAGTKGFDEAMLKARTQAENYSRALPAGEGRPPFVVVVDVGHVIELYAEFTRSGATYAPFPDSRSHRLPLARLREPAVRQRLRTLWLDPMALDPSRVSAEVTRDVAAKLAQLSRDLEADGHSPEHVAAFLTRCLFSMFAEDVGLLPKAPNGQGAFVHLLRQHRNDPEALRHLLHALWTDMDRGGFSVPLAKPVLRFNGKLFKGWAAADYVLPLSKRLISGLLGAAESNWREVEPSIIGTLLEWALDKSARHALGAHYTPRVYVERLVLPTVVEPLRAEWADAQAAALMLAREATELEDQAPKVKTKKDFAALDRHNATVRAKSRQARQQIRNFHHRLCTVRILDPACGSGNFLYVTLEHLKRLEGEVLDLLHKLGESQTALAIVGETVTPQQLLGIEINERAAALAELVLWIGYLQWQIRNSGDASVPEPVIHDYGNIEHRDAVLAFDGQVPMTDTSGKLVERWDGKTFKTHPVTGDPVPDETALVPQWRYLNTRPAKWPAADFIVGNPPFIGNKRMREALGDGYVEALRGAWPTVPESADFVMYWWEHAAMRVRAGESRRFGLITTNSITMSFNRKVIERHLHEPSPLRLVFAVADHPWTDETGSAAVRVAMTVGSIEPSPARLGEATEEQRAGDTPSGFLSSRTGVIQPDLTIGTVVRSLHRLRANAGLVFQGVIPIGDGFKLDRGDLGAMGVEATHLPDVVKPYIIGSDIVRAPRAKWVIDFTGLSEAAARLRYPTLFQRVLTTVKPVRDLNREPSRRAKWWLFARSNEEMRAAKHGLRRFIGTPDTARYRPFVFIPGDVLPDAQVYCVAADDALILGTLSSCVHQVWVIRVAPRLGVGNDIRWKPKDVWAGYPFPHEDTGLTAELATRIRGIAEQLDAQRKARQAAHPELTLTDIYHVLEKLRRAEPLTAKEMVIHTQGLVSVLKSLHDELDAAVLTAYGWSDLQHELSSKAQSAGRAAAVEILLARLVGLNARRAAEEAAGTVRWLRPEWQNRHATTQSTLDGIATDAEEMPASAAPAGPVEMAPWPAGLLEQIKAISSVLASANRPMALPDIESRFSGRGRWRDRLPTILNTLEAVGRARKTDDQRWQRL